jgi:hypothetical protein
LLKKSSGVLKNLENEMKTFLKKALFFLDENRDLGLSNDIKKVENVFFLPCEIYFIR